MTGTAVLMLTTVSMLVKTAVYSGLGPYAVDNACIDSKTIYTNKVFSTAYRGFGHLETHWSIERQIDILSQRLGIDPYDSV